MSDLQDERPAKRFKHQSYKKSLKEVHLIPALAQTQIDQDIGDNDSHFRQALDQWRELNLSPAFLQFANKADSLSASMPLLVHHWRDIIELWIQAIDNADDEALKALLSVFQKLAHDLRTTLTPLHSQILSHSLKLLARSLLADTLTILLETFSALFKYVLIPSEATEEAWSSFSDALPACDPEVQRALAELWGSALRRMKAAARENCVVAIASSASPDVSAWIYVSACKLLESHPSKVLALLSILRNDGRLDGVDSAWKQRLQSWVDIRFREWKGTEEQSLELYSVIELSDLLPNVSSLLISIVGYALEIPDPKQDFAEHGANSSWVVGSCLACLARRSSKEWQGKVNIKTWTETITEKWGWSGFALDGLLALISKSSSFTDQIPFDTVYPYLQSSLLSHSRLLRLSVLRLLSSPLVHSNNPTEIVKQCLHGEEVSLDVQGVRERTVRINRMPQVLKDGDEQGADIATRWLIAQLKVNLRPLWTPAAVALASISSRFGDQVWQLIFTELKSASGAEVNEHDPLWMIEIEEAELDSISEDERTWRDPSAHKFRCVIEKWRRGDMSSRAIIKAQLVDERFDERSYESQLLGALGECSALAEKHSRDLVPHFLTLAPSEAPTRMARQKLTAWLTLFSKFVNPKALRLTEDLRLLYTNLLSHPDRPLQRLALSCLLTYKSPSLISYQDALTALLDDTRWRDQLTQLDITAIKPGERQEVIDTLIRLLFGVMLEKRGRSRGADRHAAVLGALAGCSNEELHLLVDLMLNPINRDREAHDEAEYVTLSIPDSVSDKQLVGFMTLLGDVMKNLGSKLVDRWPILLATLLDVLAHAQHRIASKDADVTEENDPEVQVGDEDDLDGVDEGPVASRTIRTVRQLGIKRFTEFFRSPVPFDFSQYLKQAFQTSISPRLPMLDIENTQGPSSLLELFFVWSRQPESARFFAVYDERVLPKVYDCLVASNVKPPVVSKVFDIIVHILDISNADQEFFDLVFKPHIPLLLKNLATLVERNKAITTFTDQIGRRQINILSQLAPYMADSSQASALLNLFTPILRKTAKIIPEKIKVDIISILKNLFPLIPELNDFTTDIYSRTYNLLAYLFQSLRSRQARLALVATFRMFSENDKALLPLADVLESLNAYSSRRLEEPDFDRRLNAFTTLNETLYQSLSPKEWLPILYNMLNFIQEPEELTIRSSASFSMKRFIDLVAGQRGEYESIFQKTLYAGLKNGLRSKNEMVRADILGVISYAISKCDHIETLTEMRVLLAGGDEEANFFNNVLHIQVHRRTRALRRLAEYCDEGQIRSSTLADIFVPLVGNFITHSHSMDHHVTNEAIITTGRMARHLQWGPYHALIQQYLRLSRAKDASERVYVRSLVALLDNFHFPMDTPVETLDEVSPKDEEEEEADSQQIEPVVSPEARRQAYIADVVNGRLLPSLLQHLEKRDETEDSLRIPISVGIVQVAKHLPESTREPQISKLLTVLSQVFRSKSQETRDLSRETLYRIAIILGPSYLPAILRELRIALLRGPHLHILAYVTHALLVHVTSSDHAATFCQLDDCVHDVAHIAAEVIFGESGKDVQSEEFKTKMREVRSSSAKGLDSFAIIAKHIAPSKISSLLVPVRNILQQTETLKVMQQVEDLLRRVAGGLNANQYLTPKELLILCHTLISQNARFLKHVPQAPQARGKGKRDALVELKRNMVPDVDHYSNNSFRFVVFGLELFNTAHRRNRFDFQDPAVIVRLEPMVALIGNTLYSNHMQVVVPGLKAAAAIVRCPLKTIPKSLPVFIRQMINIVKQTGSTESDVVQTTFKSLATILRDQPSAQVKENDLVFLLELLSPDLEDSSRQASVFTMLRAIVARKFVVPEIYDLMDKVSEIMVTNQSPQVQELCRGVLLQFLLEYPQGKGRLRAHMTFFAKNLSYVHESGRKSVMELLSAILAKFDPALIREYSDLLFVALVMVVANDESPKCREMASELIKTLFATLEDRQRQVVMSHVHSWAIQHNQPQLARVSSQVYSIVIDFLQADITPYATSILEDLNSIIVVSATSLEGATSEEEQHMDVDMEWQVPYHTLIAISKLLRVRPELTAQQDKVPWPHIVTHLLFPHAWVRTASCRLLGLLFTAIPAAAPSGELPDESPFSVIGMEDVTKKLCLQLRSENLEGPLSLQIVKNLFYIGKCFSILEVALPATGDAEDDDEEGQDEARRNKPFGADNWWHQPASVLRWFAAMVSFLEPAQVEKFLVHILSPVYRIAEDDTIRDSHMDELKTLAVELQELVQSKVGTTKFANVYGRIRHNVVGIRRERKTARAVQATTNPGAAANRKQQRNVAKKDNRKRKNNTFAYVILF
ncbi:hypothetical protein EW026_g6070 [Hermanssonia centrifuga]|uniref:Uncharacterized protein n=1 Tax=Hermanssonia centrifuga TaxID=98765 RepID=A0A4S4KGK7_9APHY|nr:hypothetical protein EW026_g6070 [Hermanssonia centrifuga]